jgi:hypothetical protein
VVMDTLVQSSRLHVQGSCWDEGVVGMLEVSGLAGMCRRRLVGFRNMQYSSQFGCLSVLFASCLCSVYVLFICMTHVIHMPAHHVYIVQG